VIFTKNDFWLLKYCEKPGFGNYLVLEKFLMVSQKCIAGKLRNLLNPVTCYFLKDRPE
jgi:hypothetical protein